MDDSKISIAKACIEGAEGGAMTFPQIVGALTQAGFESYAIDFRRAIATYYTPDGDSIEFPTHKIDVPIAPSFEAAHIQAAIKEAQQPAPGYTYKKFCEKVASAGCTGYVVSFSGRRALYLGRTAETHVEPFPN
jgi:uncharacterized protein YbcV (DUF1398 family)